MPPRGYVKYPDLLNAEWLRARYWDDGLSADQIAELLGFECSQATVGKWLRHHGIPTRGSGEPSPSGRPKWTEGVAAAAQDRLRRGVRA